MMDGMKLAASVNPGEPGGDGGIHDGVDLGKVGPLMIIVDRDVFSCVLQKRVASKPGCVDSKRRKPEVYEGKPGV